MLMSIASQHDVLVTYLHVHIHYHNIHQVALSSKESMCMLFLNFKADICSTNSTGLFSKLAAEMFIIYMYTFIDHF